MKLSPIASCLLGSLLAACSSNSTAPAAGAAGEAGAPTFGSGACGSCLQTTCIAEIDACGGDPECAARWKCILACPAAASGNVDPTCEAACPTLTSTTGQQRDAALKDCRTGGGLAACSACGGASDAGSDTALEAGAQDWILHQQCNGSTETEPCAVCEDTHCCKTYQDCRDDTACQEYKSCAQACIADAGASCWSDCAAAHPDGVAHWAPRQACFLTFCGEPCGGEPLSTCETCANAHCASPWVAFQGDPKGFLLWACLDACGKAKSCVDACLAKHPDAVTLYEAYSACSTTSCAAECG